MPAPQQIRYRHTLLRAGEFRLDGGSMFGLIPRVVWQKQAAVDDRGRITVQHNCLLLERLDDVAPGGPLGAPKLVLIEVGTGNKLDEKSRDIFALGTRSIIDALAEVNCRPEDIQLVTATHLHFDHAGGLTRLTLPGEKPDWVGPASSFGAPRGEHGVKLTFPNAVHVAQRQEWADAVENRSVMTRTYFADHLLPIQPLLKLIDGSGPFEPGYIPGKTDMPRLPQLVRETEIAPGLFAFRVPGHTWGQQAFRFVAADGRDTVFVPDVMPTAAHLGQAYSLAYDVEPYTSSVSRHWLLREAAERNWRLVLDHEPGHPIFEVAANAKGWFDLSPA